MFRRPAGATTHFGSSIATEKVYRNRVPWALGHDKSFPIAIGRAGQAHNQTCVGPTSLRGQLGFAHDPTTGTHDRNS